MHNALWANAIQLAQDKYDQKRFLMLEFMFFEKVLDLFCYYHYN